MGRMYYNTKTATRYHRLLRYILNLRKGYLSFSLLIFAEVHIPQTLIFLTTHYEPYKNNFRKGCHRKSFYGENVLQY